jgi:hypothetical protein
MMVDGLPRICVAIFSDSAEDEASGQREAAFYDANRRQTVPELA